MFGATHIHVNPFKVGDKEKRPVRMSFVTDINIFRLLVSFATNPSNIYVLVGEVYITMLSSSGNYTLKFLPSSRTNAHKQILDNVRLNVNKQNRKLKNAMLGISKLNQHPNKIEQRCLRFLDEKLNLSSIVGLFKINDDGSVSQKMLIENLDNPGNKRKRLVKTTPCN